MQSVNNYGSYWQARSLKQMLEDIGGYVSFIDIAPGRIIVEDTYQKRFSLTKIKRIPYYIYSHKRSKMYDLYKKNAFERKTDEKYDAVVIGSDEVFNCKQQSPWGFTTQLYGDIDCHNVLSYAASFGYTDFNFIKEKGIGEEIKAALNNLSNISVRDENSQAIVNQLTGRDSDIHLDPVLLNMQLIENAEFQKKWKMNYILIYSYDFRLKEREYIEEIKKYAKQNNYKIIAAGFYQDWVDKNIIATPNEILGFFYNAVCVITDTFHGTIFSVKCHKKFATIIRESNKQKLGDLLKRLDLSEHMVDSPNRIKDIVEISTDYEKTDMLLEYERQRSISYLKNALGVK